MLVLTRRKQEEIVLGALVTIKVLRIRGDRVQLAIQAPREIEVRRVDVRKSPLDQDS